MSRQITVIAVVVMLITFATAQSDEPGGGFEKGPFSVAPAGDSAILLDTETGESWLLQHSVADREPSVWLPLQRLSGETDVAMWHAEQEDIARELAHQSRLEMEQEAELEAQLEAERELAERIRQQATGEDLLRAIRESLSELESQLNDSP